jgi:Mg2+ and Co2+ transporter CorA
MIFVFTVVTVLFLPASFIASVFGMNARDVKDMDVGQWAFWVTALSVTALVVCAAMWSGVWVRLGLGGDLGKKGEVVE